MATIRLRGKRWQVQVRRQGHGLLTRTFTSKRDADAWALLTEAAIERGDAGLGSSRSTLTLAELVERYRDNVSIRKKGHDVERIVLNAFLRQPLALKRVSDLSASDFAQYRDERLKKVKRNTLRREFSMLHHMFEVARIEWGMDRLKNPLATVPLGPPSPHRERRLFATEEERLLQSAQGCRREMISIIIRLALETAMRRSELLGLRWSDVDLVNRYVLVRDPKNGVPRQVPLTRGALDLFEHVPREDAHVFTISVNAFRLTWERVRKRAGLSDFHFHDLRHEAVSRLFERGLTAPEVASISGHRDARMLFRYAHPIRQRVLAVLDASDRR